MRIGVVQRITAAMPILHQCPVYVLYHDYQRNHFRTQLNFDGWPLDDVDLRTLAVAARQFADSGKNVSASRAALTEPESLSIYREGYNNVDDDDADVDDSTAGTGQRRTYELRSLSLRGCTQISDTGLRDLTKRCRFLLKLDLRGCLQLTDHALRYIGKSCSRIESVLIGSRSAVDSITDKGVIGLTTACKFLRQLYVVFSTKITDAFLRHLATRPSNSRFGAPLQVRTHYRCEAGPAPSCLVTE